MAQGGGHGRTGSCLCPAWMAFKQYHPNLPPHVPKWQKFAARCVHLAFYGFMFALPLSGWLMSSAAGIPVTFFGLFILPDLISTNIYKMELLIEIHKWLAHGLIVTIFGHIGAALFHHFVYKDDTLRRMLPPSSI